MEKNFNIEDIKKRFKLVEKYEEEMKKMVI
jgi:hypothetical protein